MIKHNHCLSISDTIVPLRFSEMLIEDDQTTPSFYTQPCQWMDSSSHIWTWKDATETFVACNSWQQTDNSNVSRVPSELCFKSAGCMSYDLICTHPYVLRGIRSGTRTVVLEGDRYHPTGCYCVYFLLSRCHRRLAASLLVMITLANYVWPGSTLIITFYLIIIIIIITCLYVPLTW